IGVPFLEGRRLANVAQTEAKTLEREFQDVGERRKGLGKYGKQSRGLLSNFGGREQGDVGRLVDRVRSGSLLILPLAAELQAMRAFLPRQVVGENVAAQQAALRGIGFVAETESGAVDFAIRASESPAVPPAF